MPRMPFRSPRTPAPALLVAAIGVAVVASALGAPGAAGAPQRPAATCDGHRATIVGTNGPDTIRGTRKRDVIQARGGDDFIRGLGGSDLICSGTGRDQVVGGPGDDAIHLSRMSVGIGGTGNDRIWSKAGLARGGPGDDTLRGDVGADFLYGDAGNDRIIDSSGSNIVADTSGRSVIRLGSGNDFVETAGYATVSTGSGDDRVFGTGAISTGPGTDFVRYATCTTCTSTDRFAVNLGADDDAMTIGEGVDSASTGSPAASTIPYSLDGGTGSDSLNDWFRLGAAVRTVVELGPAGSLSGPWQAAELENFENYSASEEETGPRVFTVTGSDDANIISIFGSGSFIYGLGGDDTLGSISTTDHIFGGDGDDYCETYLNQQECEFG